MSGTIDIDDLARIDAHAEYAALEYSLQPKDQNSPEWEEWAMMVGEHGFGDSFGKTVIQRVGSYEIHVFLDTAGVPSTQVHELLFEDANGNPREPYLPEPGRNNCDPGYKPWSYTCACLGEPVLTPGRNEVKAMAEAFAKADLVMTRYESEWERQYAALGCDSKAPR